MTVCYLPKPSSPPANNTALPTSTTPLPTFPSTDHFSFYLLTYVLSPLPSPVHPGAVLPTTSVTELLPTQARQLISLFSLRTTPQACFFFFFLRTYPLFPSPGRRDRTADLLVRHGLPYKRQRCDYLSYQQRKLSTYFRCIKIQNQEGILLPKQTINVDISTQIRFVNLETTGGFLPQKWN